MLGYTPSSLRPGERPGGCSRSMPVYCLTDCITTQTELASGTRAKKKPKKPRTGKIWGFHGPFKKKKKIKKKGSGTSFSLSFPQTFVHVFNTGEGGIRFLLFTEHGVARYGDAQNQSTTQPLSNGVYGATELPLKRNEEAQFFGWGASFFFSFPARGTQTVWRSWTRRGFHPLLAAGLCPDTGYSQVSTACPGGLVQRLRFFVVLPSLPRRDTTFISFAFLRRGGGRTTWGRMSEKKKSFFSSKVAGSSVQRGGHFFALFLENSNHFGGGQDAMKIMDMKHLEKSRGLFVDLGLARHTFTFFLLLA